MTSRMWRAEVAERDNTTTDVGEIRSNHQDPDTGGREELETLAVEDDRDIRVAQRARDHSLESERRNTVEAAAGSNDDNAPLLANLGREALHANLRAR